MFDKLQHYLKGGDTEPQSDVDMKKASMIRYNFPKYKDWSIKELKNDPIWTKANTNGIVRKK